MVDDESDKGDSDDDDDDSDDDDGDAVDMCQVCDKLVTSDANAVRCTSRCNGVQHRACVSQSPAFNVESFECTECAAGNWWRLSS